MGIKFHCESCERKLNVKAFLAGKRGICPHCGAKVRIPDTAEEIEKPAQVPAQQASEPAGEMVVDFSAVVVQQHAGAAETASLPSSDSSHAATPTGTDNSDTEIARPSARESISETDDPGDPISAAPDAKWYVRPPSGGQYGPADGHIMRKWISEGRVSGDSLIWREGWADWKPAGPEFLGLTDEAATPPEPVASKETPTQVPQVESDETPVRESRPVRRKASNLGIAIVIILGLMVFLLSITLLVIVLRQDDNSDETSNRRPTAVVVVNSLKSASRCDWNFPSQQLNVSPELL